MDTVAELRREISRKFSSGSSSMSRHFSLKRLGIGRQSSLEPKLGARRFSLGRQSSLDPILRHTIDNNLEVPQNLDATMRLLFTAHYGDVEAVEALLNEGVDVNSMDLDGRTALHIAACEGHLNVVELLLNRKANIDSRDRWGSTAALDARYYGNKEVYDVLKSRGAKVPKTGKTPMTVTNPLNVPVYEVDPRELSIQKGEKTPKGTYQVAKWNGTKVAIKIFDKERYSDSDSLNSFNHELRLLQKVRHPNVLQFVGAVTQNVPMMIVSEYHPGGDLGNYLQKGRRIKISKSLKFALDIARGINYLHECKPEAIIHGDLKPKNVFMDASGALKVAGFGLVWISRIHHNEASPIAGSGPYMAPEIYKNDIFDTSADAFSFGMIFYEMIEGTPPFHPNSPEIVAKMIYLEGKRPPFKLKSKKYPPDLRELITECWDDNPDKRPVFSNIIERLENIASKCSKQGWLKDTALKILWK